MNDPALLLATAVADPRYPAGEDEPVRGEEPAERHRADGARAKRAGRGGRPAMAARRKAEAGIRRSGRAADAEAGPKAGRAGPGRKRPTLGDLDRLTDALRVTRAVLRRIEAHGRRIDAGDAEAMRSAVEAADAALGGST